MPLLFTDILAIAGVLPTGPEKMPSAHAENELNSYPMLCAGDSYEVYQELPSWRSLTFQIGTN
jgi:hypothetical protein